MNFGCAVATDDTNKRDGFVWNVTFSLAVDIDIINGITPTLSFILDFSIFTVFLLIRYVDSITM